MGQGQSEVDIDQVTDLLLLVVPPGGGDGLQASKKGIMEVADLVVVSKADGSLLDAATHTRADYESSLSYIRPKHLFWRPRALLVSAITGSGLSDLRNEIHRFHTSSIQSGGLQRRRKEQRKHLAWSCFSRALLARA